MLKMGHLEHCHSFCSRHKLHENALWPSCSIEQVNFVAQALHSSPGSEKHYQPQQHTTFSFCGCSLLHNLAVFCKSLQLRTEHLAYAESTLSNYVKVVSEGAY